MKINTKRNNFIVSILFAFGLNYLSAQDIILTKKDKLVYCKITKITFSAIIFTEDTAKRFYPIDSVAGFYTENQEISNKLDDRFPAWQSLFNPKLKNKLVSTTNKSEKSNDALSETITYFTSSKFGYKDNNNLSLNEIKDLLNTNSESRKYLSKANTNLTFGYIFGITGGFCVGYPLGGALAGKELNAPMLGIGAGAIAVAIVFQIGYSTNIKKAVKAYNESLVEKNK